MARHRISATCSIIIEGDTGQILTFQVVSGHRANAECAKGDLELLVSPECRCPDDGALDATGDSGADATG